MFPKYLFSIQLLNCKIVKIFFKIKYLYFPKGQTFVLFFMNNTNVLYNVTSLIVQLDTLKATVDGTAAELESMRTTVTNLKKEIQDKTLRYALIKYFKKS